MLSRIDSDYILLMLDDFLLRERVDNSKIQSCLNALQELRGSYLRLRPAPLPDKRVHGYPLVGELTPGAPYRTSLQAAIWRRSELVRLLRDGESPWDMEFSGSRRSDDTPGFYGVWAPALHYRHCIERGLWLRYAVRICRRERIPIDLTLRPVMSLGDTFKRWCMLHVVTAPLKLVSLRTRLRLTQRIRALLQQASS